MWILSAYSSFDLVLMKKFKTSLIAYRSRFLMSAIGYHIDKYAYCTVKLQMTSFLLTRYYSSASVSYTHLTLPTIYSV